MDQNPLDFGLGDVPPVEREMAALTSPGPDSVLANPRCPHMECGRTDRLVGGKYNAAARAASSGNALSAVTAALRRMTAASDQDT